MSSQDFSWGDRRDLRAIATIFLLVVLGGSWAILLVVVPFDDAKPVDGAVLVMIFASAIIGAIIGMFNWLGFRQGQNQNQMPAIQVPEGYEAVIKNGILTIKKVGETSSTN